TPYRNDLEVHRRPWEVANCGVRHGVGAGGRLTARGARDGEAHGGKGRRQSCDLPALAATRGTVRTPLMRVRHCTRCRPPSATPMSARQAATYMRDPAAPAGSSSIRECFFNEDDEDGR